MVSVIMAVRNEEKYISRSLYGVLRQDYPPGLIEVLMADGMSVDRTRALIYELKLAHPSTQISLFDNPGLTVSTGLNLALRHSRGEIVVRVDGKTEVAPDYVRQCVALLAATGADNVGGRRRPLGQGLVGEAIALGISSRFGVGGDNCWQSTRQGWTDTVYLGAWRREVFESLGFFDEEMAHNQDDEFNYRLRKFGGRILVSPLIRCTYANRDSLRALGRQYFEFGWWKVRVLQKHPRQMRWRQFMPPTLVASLILAMVGSVFFTGGRVLLVSAAGAYILVNLAATVMTARGAGIRQFAVLPFVFATLHLSYGLGFVAGLVHYTAAGRSRSSSDRSVAYRG